MMINKQFDFIFIITLFFCLLVIGPKSVITTYAAPSDQKLFDDANLFTDKEKDKLESIITKNEKKGTVDIAIITKYDIGDKTRKEFLEDFYDEYGFGYNKEHGDTALILINMDPSDRGVEIQAYGAAEDYIDDDRIEHILDDIVPLLSNREFFKASKLFTKQAAYYMGNPSGYYVESNTLKTILIRAAISIVAGIIVVGIMAYNSSGKVTTTDRTYLDSGTSRLVAHHDTYIRTSTSKVRKPTQQSASGGGGRSSGGGGVSRGGHSHSGGGRSF